MENKKTLPTQETENIEFKTILPPPNIISRLICAFANTNGGKIYIGIGDKGEIIGVDKDIPATNVIETALKQLTPIPNIKTTFEFYDDKQIFTIDVEKSEVLVKTIDGKLFRRVGEQTRLLEGDEIAKLIKFTHPKVNTLRNKITTLLTKATNSKNKYLEHIVVILKIIDEQKNIIYTPSSNKTPNTLEGKLITRLLFSSCVDTFEGYFSDILYEVYLAKPDTLKSSEANVAVKDILECTDIQEFVVFWSKKQISKLQRGSLKEFLTKHKQISAFTKLFNDANTITDIEKIMQIRHLYSHRNGVIDDKFIQYMQGSYTLNTEHILSITEFCDKLEYLIDVVEKTDIQLINDYNLTTN